MVASFKGSPQGGQFIDKASCWPDIWFLIVLPIPDLLRRHVVGRANMGLCEFRVLSHLTAESKVSQFHMVSLINEDIGRFDVPMQHLTPSPSLISRPCMAVFKCQQQLVTYLPDNFLLYLSLSLLGLFQLSPEIATRAVLHDDVYLGGSFVHHAIDISHDVRVVQFFQEVDLCDQLLLLPTAHLLEIDLFPHQDLATLFGTHFSDYSEGALADLFERDVLVHLNF